VKLVDLAPRWFGLDGVTYGLTFLCPHCKKERLGVAFHHAGKELMEDAAILAHSPTTNHIWTMTGDEPKFDGYEHSGFDNVTLTPSIDASASGHWHGFITKGEVT
jgi:hypothetical protein